MPIIVNDFIAPEFEPPRREDLQFLLPADGRRDGNIWSADLEGEKPTAEERSYWETRDTIGDRELFGKMNGFLAPEAE